MSAIRIALLNIRLVMRTKVALFFTFLFPVIFLFVYAGIFAHGNPQAVAYFFGPIVTLTIMGSAFWGLGLQSVMQRERGSLRRYRLAPLTAGDMVTSSLVANYLLQLPTVALLVFCAMVVFHMPLKIGLAQLLILVTIGAFSFAGFGLTIASVANTMQEAQVYNNLAWFTLLFLSGVTIPLPMLPNWIQSVAEYLPSTYLVNTFQAIMAKGDTLRAHWPELLGLTIAGAFGLLVAFKLFRWEKEEKLSSRQKWSAALLGIPFLVIGSWMSTRSNVKSSWSMTYAIVGRGGSGSPGGGAGSNLAPDHGTLVEGFDLSQADTQTLLKHWQISSDFAPSGRSVAELSLVSPGAEGTPHALRIQGRMDAAPEGKPYLAARYQVTVPAGLEEFNGMEFWMKGDGKRAYQITLKRADSMPDFEAELRQIPPPNWIPVHLYADWFSTDRGSPPRPLPLELDIFTTGAPGDFDFEIDQIKFF